MLEIALGVGMFTSVVLALVFVILIARAWLVPTGNVEVVVNDERHIASPVGVKLSDALSAAELYVPTACGGGGTCGQCRVKVFAGGEPSYPRKQPTSTSARPPKETGCRVRSLCART